MTSKNAFGSMPFALVKSVPVFLSDAIAARMPWTAATQLTSEKTIGHRVSLKPSIQEVSNRTLTDDFRPKSFRLLRREGRREPTRDDVHEDGLRRKRRDGILQKLGSLDTFDEAHIGTGVGGELQTKNGLFHTQYLRGVRASNDDLSYHPVSICHIATVKE